MPLLSRDWNQRKTRYDFVIVGSGYGGAISAARLSAADTNPKPSVCVLERGREWPVGEFPDTFPKFTDEVRSNLNPLGLYDLLNYRDISVIKGNGLGGTSLVNANVAILPDEEVFKLTGWPASLTRQVLLPYYARAKRVLAAGVHPEPKKLVKLTALQKRADQLGVPVDLLDIAVNFTIEGENEYGATQAKCTNCGDCVSGCNVGAKNTLYMNYLPMAARAGAEIYTQTKVEYVEKLAGGGWKIHGRRYKDRFSSDKFTLEARNVILAAGSINSTEILMRSEHNGLACSPRLGSNFSGNGDFFAFSYNGDHYLQTLGFGKHPESPGAATPPGPTITGAVRYNGDRPTVQRFLVEDVSFPRALFQAAQQGLPLFRGEDTDTGDEAAEEQRRFLDITQQQPYARDGALNHTMLYLVTAFDNAQGRMEFDAPFWERDGRMRVVWDNGGRQRVFQVINEELRRHARSLGSRFVENPVWSAFDLRRLVTAHPLGGCPVGEDYLHGAVDEYGRVFSGDGAVHDGLQVADGALLPSALGVNPFMTISAMAERIVERKIEELKGRPYEAPKKVSLAGIDPMDYIGSSDSQIKRLFQRTTTLPIEKLVNSGQLSIDPVTRRITNDKQWKGFFPSDLPIGQLAALLYTGYTKRFKKEGDAITGTTQSSDGMLQARNTLEEINLTESKGGLDPGRYILLHYPDPPWQGFYDLLKIINDNLLVLHVYLGEYPHGIRSFGGIMVRSYSFEQMTAEDHAEAYKAAVKPTKEQLEGVWRMDVISNANQASGLAWLRFNNKPDGRLEARYQLMGLLEGIIMPRFAQDHFRLDDFTPFRDEIKRIDDNLMIGKWITEVPDIFTAIFPVGSVGIFHVEPAEGGRKRFGFYYLLTRATEKEMAERSLIYPLLGVQLPAGVGLKFEETMDGWYDAAAAEIPKDEKRTPGAVDCRFTLKMTAADINEFIEGVEHETRLTGSILWKGATFPIDEKESRFNLFIVNAKTKEAEIRYYLVFRDSEGRRVILDGRKYMQSDRAPGAPRGAQEILHDFTTLYANLTVDGAPAGVAYLKFRTFEDLPAIGNMIGFVMSMQVTGAAGDILVEWRARTRFLAFIGQFLQSEYDPLAPAFEETRLRTAAG